jgi:hypothetical protein
MFVFCFLSLELFPFHWGQLYVWVGTWIMLCNMYGSFVAGRFWIFSSIPYDQKRKLWWNKNGILWFLEKQLVLEIMSVHTHTHTHTYTHTERERERERERDRERQRQRKRESVWSQACGFLNHDLFSLWCPLCFLYRAQHWESKIVLCFGNSEHSEGIQTCPWMTLRWNPVTSWRGKI